ncbi:MAG: hypothetical protein WCW13_01670 [archaeon]
MICLIAILSFANATILASTSVDKKNLSTDEIGLLSVKLFNDSNTPAKNVLVRIQADNQIRFVTDTEESLFITNIETITGGEGKEILLKIKSVSSAKPSANIYTYFGNNEPLTQAVVTMVGTVELAATEKITAEKKNVNGKDTVLVSFLLTNLSEEVLTKASAEVIAPKDFEIITAPIMVETIAINGKLEKTFQIIAPLDAQGQQKIIVAYGYFDSNAPHYFEKQFLLNFQKPNYSMIILIGLIVVIVAGYLYIKRDDKKQLIKGTSEKK